MANQKTVQLLGILKTGALATNGQNIYLFIGEGENIPNYFQLQVLQQEKARLTTPKGRYLLKMDRAGIYRGKAPKTSLQIKLTENIGELKFWA